MSIESLIKIRSWFLVAAILGFITINLPFLYFSLIERSVYQEAIGNGMALVFMGEAFLLMFFFAFLIAKLGWKKPGWLFFLGMSLLGGLAFSIPLQIYVMLGKRLQNETS
ncbi:MAG: hypothetical protein AAF558_03070 [Verrucomicrobiota bacterium]